VKAAAPLRVLGGELKGRRLASPARARPTEGRVREALASIWGAELEGAEVLDLFAGSGAVGVELLSRGALRATFVESDRRAAETLARNLADLDLSRSAARTIVAPALGALADLAARGERFDLVFVDPPYAWPPTPELWAAVAGVLAPGGALAFEHSARTVLPAEVAGMVRVELRRYGETALGLYRKPR
jgi:16S rRNA (guanine(966)-N(2))-methyltransferase RsmD